MYLFYLFLIYLISTVIVVSLRPRNNSNFGNSIYYLFVFGFIFYAGTVIAKNEIPSYYLLMYFVFLVTLGVSYRFFYKLLLPIGNYSNRSLGCSLIPFAERNSKKIIILFYVLTILPLLVPNFRLGLVLSPPAPDLVSIFGWRMEGGEKHPFIRIAELIKLLLVPFFYLAIFSFRKNLTIVVSIIISIFYLEYIDTAYKSRGQLIAALFPILFYVWHFFPKYRKPIVILMLAIMPLAIIFFNFFENYRLGADVSLSDFSLSDSLEHILNAETSFPSAVGISIIESGARVDLGSYFTWIFTLPIPKFIFGEISGARINTEISEIFLGVSKGSAGFFIILPGLIAESVYIFGNYFYWIHAVFLGLIIAFLTRIFQGSKNFAFLVGYLAILMMYNTNRGGISSSLAQIVNELLLVYLILFITLLKKRPQSTINVLG